MFPEIQLLLRLMLPTTALCESGSWAHPSDPHKEGYGPGFSMDCLWDRKASCLRSLCLQLLVDQVREIMILLLRAVLEGRGGDAWGALRTVPNTQASQLQQQCHQVLLCSAGHPVHCRKLSIPGLFPLDTSCTPSCLQALPNVPWGRAARLAIHI